MLDDKAAMRTHQQILKTTHTRVNRQNKPMKISKLIKQLSDINETLPFDGNVAKHVSGSIYPGALSKVEFDRSSSSAILSFEDDDLSEIAFNAAIEYTLGSDQGLTFLRMWNDNDWKGVAESFPDFDLSTVDQ